jgi:hydrogenase maturation protease
MTRTPLLILGLGNVLCSDDGLGVAAVSRLQRDYQAPDGVEVLDGGTLGMALLPYLMQADIAILVDAIRTDDPPGTAVRLDGADVLPAARNRLSPHQVGVVDLLDGAMLRGEYPGTVILIGLVPRGTDLGIELAPEVEAGLPGLIDAVVAEAARLGFPLSPQSGDASRYLWSTTGISGAPALLGM